VPGAGQSAVAQYTPFGLITEEPGQALVDRVGILGVHQQRRITGGFERNAAHRLRPLRDWPRLRLEQALLGFAPGATEPEHRAVSPGFGDAGTWLAELPWLGDAVGIGARRFADFAQQPQLAYALVQEPQLRQRLAQAITAEADISVGELTPAASTRLHDDAELLRFADDERTTLLRTLADWAWEDIERERGQARGALLAALALANQALDAADQALARASAASGALDPALADWSRSIGRRRLQAERALLQLWHGGPTADAAAATLHGLARVHSYTVLVRQTLAFRAGSFARRSRHCM